MKLFESVEMFSGSDKLNRHSGYMFDRKSSTATGIAIKFGHDAAIKFKRIVEPFGTFNGILPCHSIHNQVDLIGLHLPVNR